MNIGAVYLYGGNQAPNGFLLCNGAEVSRTTYSELYNAIGVTFGNGDGSSTFNLPNLTGKVVVGVSQNYAMGDTGGEESHVLVENELPSHSHSIPSHTHSNNIAVTTPILSHTITQPTFSYTAPGGTANRYYSSGLSGGYRNVTSTNATRSANLSIGNHTGASCVKTGGVETCASFNTLSDGNDAQHNNMQPFVSLNYVIYTGVYQ